MLNSTEIIANALSERLAETYTRAFSSREPRYAELIGEAPKLVLERIGMSDALYHSAEHTALVTLVGQRHPPRRGNTASLVGGGLDALQASNVQPKAGGTGG